MDIATKLAELRAKKAGVQSSVPAVVVSNAAADMDNLLDSGIPGSIVKKPTESGVGTTGNAINVLEVQAKIAELSEKLLTAHPLMPVLLRTIHTHLRKDPEIVTLLNEEEIGIVVNGLKLVTNTVLVTTTAKKVGTKSEKAKLKDLGVDDI